MTMTPSRSIFRRAAVDRLSSPEQLDRLATVADPLGWLAFATLAALIAAVAVWGFVGSIPEKVKGEGLLMAKDARIVDAMAPASGVVADLLVGLGDRVAAGQPLLRLDQPDLARQIRAAAEVQAEREAELSQLRANAAREVEAKRASTARQRTAQRAMIAAARDRVTYLENVLARQEESAAKGFTSRQKVEETRADLNRIRQGAMQAEAEIAALDAQQIDLASRQQEDLTRAEQRVAEARREVERSQQRLAERAPVAAPVAGRITEVKQSRGAVVAEGMPLLSIESEGGALQALVFLPTEDGKKVRPGMKALIAPDTVRKEEHGAIEGAVAWVSDFPVSQEGMTALLRNPQLVQGFARKGAPYAVRIDLATDATTPTGLRWTSAGGPDVEVTSGTSVKAEVVVRERRPADMVVPLIKKNSGINW